MKTVLTIELGEIEYNFTVDISVTDYVHAEPENDVQESFFIAVEKRPTYVGTVVGNGQQFTFEAWEIFDNLQDEVNGRCDELAQAMRDDAQETTAARRWEDKQS